MCISDRIDDGILQHDTCSYDVQHGTLRLVVSGSDLTRPTRQIHDQGINTGSVQCKLLVNFDGLDRLDGSTGRPSYKNMTCPGKLTTIAAPRDACLSC